MTNIVLAVVGSSAAIALFFVINKVFPYQKRKYLLSDSGITISKGNRQKSYSWSEFECFYPYSERNNTTYMGAASEMEKNISGEVFYLKKKQEGASKKFVVVYSEAENTKEVKRFLSNHLECKQMNNSSDLGFVSYEFK